ncbi:MAG: LysR family transcriptional regulator [Clostridia bacterium]|nr:LysR family transcriptional regulator [Clostridia bacterium]
MFKKARYVLTVYQLGSFTKVAEALYVSQPCLSAAIKQIEAEMGARLFDRSTSSVRPTPVGLEYIKTAQQIVALEDEFALKMHDVNALLSGRIRIGGSNYVCSYILPTVIEFFSRSYPHVTVELTEEHSFRLAEMLQKGELDITIDSFDRDPERCVYTPLFAEKILLAVPQNSKSNEGIKRHSASPEDLYLQSKNADTLTAVSIEHFKNEKFILLKPENSMYDHAVRIFKKNGITPPVGLLLDQLSTSFSLCAQGGGCAFVTDTMFKYHKFDNSILLYNVDDCEFRSFGVAYRKEPYTARVIKEFVRIAKECIR